MGTGWSSSKARGGHENPGRGPGLPSNEPYPLERWERPREHVSAAVADKLAANKIEHGHVAPASVIGRVQAGVPPFAGTGESEIGCLHFHSRIVTDANACSG